MAWSPDWTKTFEVGGWVGALWLVMPTGALACECKGMTWTWGRRVDDVYLVQYDARTNAYQGDTACSVSLPILCLRKENRSRPASLERVDFYHGWTGGRLAVTQPYPGVALTSRETADNLCAKAFGAGWAMGEHHDGGGGWGWYAYGKGRMPDGRVWVAINDQSANPWNSCPSKRNQER